MNEFVQHSLFSIGRGKEGVPRVTDYMGCPATREEVEAIATICLELLKSAEDGQAEEQIRDFIEKNSFASRPVTAVPPKATEGYVYLLQAEGTERWKIGRSSNFYQRLATLRKQSPFPLVVEHVIFSQEHEALEAALHEKFRERRVYGEWFNLTPSDIEAIKMIGGVA